MSASLFLCLICFGISFIAARRSLVHGLITVFAIGYAYGIVRANLPETYSHFIFDSGVLGLYSAQLFRRLGAGDQYKLSALRPWFDILIAWPLLLVIVPTQDLLIQFVGLRGSVFLLPFIIFGARLDGEERYRLAFWLASLNLLVFAFASAEFLWGIEHFFPRSKVTELIYLSKDVGGHSAYRIPATFVNAHAYGGTMAATMPMLLGALVQKHKVTWHKTFFFLALGVSVLGVFMCGARLTFAVTAILIMVALFSMRTRFGYALGWLVLMICVGWIVAGEQRLQRFTEIKNTDVIAERVSWSVNMGFFEAMKEYPFGNGLGGGGTSIPYFLQDRISNPVAMENEYGRIMLEQGVVGLLLWTFFVFWVLTRKQNNTKDEWKVGRRIAWLLCAASFASGLIGTGLFTSVPQSALMFLLIGWVGARQPDHVEVPARVKPDTFVIPRLRSVPGAS
jgi:hypothetical protein